MLVSKLPLLFLLIHSVVSVNIKNQELRRNTQVKRTFNSNKPPSVENFDSIPVTVVYDDQEVIKLRNNKVQRSNLKQSRGQSSNRPSSINLRPVDMVSDDYDGDEQYRSKSRSIKIAKLKTAHNAKENDTITGVDSVESEVPERQKTLRRRSQVRKLKVNKSQLGAYINETNVPTSIAAPPKAEKSESKLKIEQTRANEQIPKRKDAFPKRKQLPEPVVPIIESESYVFAHSGNFHYSYEGGDGTKAFERGELKSLNGGSGSAVEGNFSYRGKDGNDYSLSYTADENGYRPVGKHLPTPPPIPPAIQRALDLLATKTTPEPITERIKPLRTF